jgi:hypothetical protein
VFKNGAKSADSRWAGVGTTTATKLKKTRGVLASTTFSPRVLMNLSETEDSLGLFNLLFAVTVRGLRRPTVEIPEQVQDVFCGFVFQGHPPYQGTVYVPVIRNTFRLITAQWNRSSQRGRLGTHEMLSFNYVLFSSTNE